MGQAGLPLEVISPLEVTFQEILVPTVGTLPTSNPAAGTKISSNVTFIFMYCESREIITSQGKPAWL